MIAATAIPDDGRPALLRGVRTHWDRVRGRWFLLAPERAMALDEIGAAILAEADGERPFAEIVARLAARYDAPPEHIAGDARAFLAALIERRMVEVRR
jgi:pyrroloquinoline quinone biosynthesis protein D